MDKVDNLIDLIAEISSHTPVSATFSVPIGKYTKAKLRLVGSEDEAFYQVSRFTDKQVFHTNYPMEDAGDALTELFSDFLSFHVVCRDLVFDGRISKRGKPLYSVKMQRSDALPESHDRQKHYMFDDDIPPCLVDLGIVTADGKIRQDGSRKYAQINRFSEIIDDVFRGAECHEIVDFGCGKSYLSFLVYHYFRSIRHMPVHMVGLDLKSDVIENCNALARKYGYDGLTFECGDIADYQFASAPDLVMWLHACDTATDHAIFGSVRSGAKHIIAVPCCQHEVAQNVRPQVLTTLFEYGIIKERVCALITDTIRAKCLEYCGYNVDLMEFVDYAVSPKNLLLRARYVGIPEDGRRQAIRREILSLIDAIGFCPTLPRLLKIVVQDDYVE